MTLKVDGTNGVLQAYDYQVLTTGFTYTFAAGVQLLLAVPAGTLASGTVTMPASPVDGMNITITSTQQITALTVNGNTGQSIVGGATSLKAGSSQTFVYRLSNTTWYNQGNNATIPASGYSGVNAQVFTASGTFTIPAGITTIKVTVVGGGGAGGTGQVSSIGCGQVNGGGGGGGGGGTAIKYLTGLTPGNTLTVTRGAAAGTSSVASGTESITTVSATGGSAGSAGATTGGLGGSGGVGSGGNANINGGAGQTGSGNSYSPTAIAGGVGGSSTLGGGGRAGNSTSLAGVAGGSYGGGGGGGGASGAVGAGGAGATGVVIFEW